MAKKTKKMADGGLPEKAEEMKTTMAKPATPPAPAGKLTGRANALARQQANLARFKAKHPDKTSVIANRQSGIDAFKSRMAAPTATGPTMPNPPSPASGPTAPAVPPKASDDRLNSTMPMPIPGTTSRLAPKLPAGITPVAPTMKAGGLVRGNGAAIRGKTRGKMC